MDTYGAILVRVADPDLVRSGPFSPDPNLTMLCKVVKTSTIFLKINLILILKNVSMSIVS